MTARQGRVRVSAILAITASVIGVEVLAARNSPSLWMQTPLLVSMIGLLGLLGALILAFQWDAHSAVLVFAGLLFTGFAFVPPPSTPLQLLRTIGMAAVGQVIVFVGYVTHWRPAHEWMQEEFDKVRDSEDLKPPPFRGFRPAWLQDGLRMTYREEDGEETRHEVVDSPGRSGVRSLYLRDPESRKENEDYEKEAAAAEGREVEPTEEWHEYSMEEWLSWHQDNVFIDPRRAASSIGQKDGVSKFVRVEPVPWRGLPLASRLYLAEKDRVCSCTAGRRIAIFWLGPGWCSLCGGLFSRQRKCQSCGGNGRCRDCGGTKRAHFEWRSWFEQKSGLLLREETKINGTVRYWEALEELTPDLLASTSIATQDPRP